MNTTSVKVKFRRPSIESKEGVLYYQVIHLRIVRQIHTNYSIFESEWHDEEERIILSKNLKGQRKAYLLTISEQLRKDLLHLTQIINELDSRNISYITDDVVVKFTDLKARQSFRVYIQHIINTQKKQGRIRTSETYSTTMRSFVSFLSGKDIMLESITPALMKSYEIWLKAKGLSLNSISFYMRILRSVYNHAVSEDLVTDLHPFAKVYTGIAKTSKRGISICDMSRILHLDLSDKPSRSFARDIFMFSFYTRGMSLIDIAKLTPSDINNGILIYQRSKTSQQISVKWRPEMQTIVDRYHHSGNCRLLPIIKSESDIRRQYDSALHLINYHLKKIGVQLGLCHPLTMYVARHSWASAACQNNIPLHIISQCLGHNSEQTTQIYLANIDVNQMDEANEKIIRKLK